MDDEKSSTVEADSGATGATNQSLERAFGLLEAVVEKPMAGSSLGELVTATGLAKPTAHRLLISMRKLGLVEYDSAARRFFPGLKLFRMGLASAARFDIVELVEPAMSRLADDTGDTIYLYLRAGHLSMCAARKLGAFPIRTLTLNVGDFRALGLGAGSLALLAALDDAEVDEAITRNLDKLAQHSHFDPISLKAMVAQARQQGFAINEGLMLPDMSAVAVPIRDMRGKPMAALSVAAIRSRMTPARRETIVRQLKRECAAVEALLGGTARAAA